MSKENPFLWLALDGLGTPGSHITPELLRRLWAVEGNWGPKINLDTLLELGCENAVMLLPDAGHERSRPRFGDGKTKNGTRTMKRVVDVAARAGFTHWNFHLDRCDDLVPVTARARRYGLITMGLTEFSHGEVTVDNVTKLTKDAETSGLDEVIMPAAVAEHISTRLPILGTGFRPNGPDRDQPLAMHPQAAVGLVDSVAIGSPIMEARDPVAALKQHLAWLACSSFEM